MKITIDVECSADEARQFLGLPDVKPMQDALMQQLQDQLSATIAAMDPESMMKAWLPASLQGLEQFQRLFWAQMGAAMGPGMGPGGDGGRR